MAIIDRVKCDGDGLYETAFRCSKCKAPLQEEKDASSVEECPCPSCGERSLTVARNMLWD